MSFQRSGKTPSPEGYRNLGKSRSCQHSGILQDCFHRAGALESLQRFALQDFKRQNGTALLERFRFHFREIPFSLLGFYRAIALKSHAERSEAK